MIWKAKAVNRSSNPGVEKFLPKLVSLSAQSFHIPLGASQRLRGKSPEGLYADVVQEIDWGVGEIRRALKERRQMRAGSRIASLVTSSLRTPRMVRSRGRSTRLMASI